ncbi:MAG: hypothetical protein HGB12_09130 [Bacteroidetes bacterium]|nr:hypothetical protein [Bacteroidota bacterium]
MKTKLPYASACGGYLFITFYFQFFFTLSLTMCTFYCSAQGVAINTTGNAANAKAMLDVDASGMNPKAGVLLPRLSTEERNAINPGVTEAGLIIYNTDCNNINLYNGTTWVDMAGNAVTGNLTAAPNTGTHTPSKTQIVWNWNTVSGAIGYKWNTTNTNSTATDMGTALTKTETALTCNTAYTRYVWAYNNCGCSVSSTTLTQTTSSCWDCGDSLTDSRDGKKYKTISIGSQCWMEQNLNYGTYIDVTTSGTGTGQNQANTQKYCLKIISANVGANDASCSMGGLYEWAEMMDGVSVNNINATACNGTALHPACTTPVQGICPAGWHIPSHYEWTLLENNISSGTVFPYDEVADAWYGTNEGAKLRSNSDWGSSNCCNLNGNCSGGTCNSSGFTALPGGASLSGSFIYPGTNGYWWSSSKTGANEWGRNLTNTEANVRQNDWATGLGFSLRCIQN